MKARLLRGPGRRARGDGPADQERVPQARAEASPRSQSQRSRGGGTLQGGRRGLRGPRGSGEARALRPFRPRRRERGAGRRGVRPDDLRGLLRHLLGARRRVRLRRSLRRPPAPRRPAARIGSALRPRDHVSRSRRTAPRRRSRFPREESCETCEGSGAAAGTTAETCNQCRGTGQLRYQQGFLTVARPCPNCRGTGKTIAKPCQTCRGAGRVGHDRKLTVKIPAGIATGQRLRLQSEGEHGTAGGPPGDLYVVVHVQDHHFFHREGDDLFCELPIGYPTLALGGTVKVPTLNGRDELHIPAGTQPGARFKLRGKGMPNVSGRGHGDLHVIAGVAVPTEAHQGTEAPARGAVEDAAAAGR